MYTSENNFINVFYYKSRTIPYISIWKNSVTRCKKDFLVYRDNSQQNKFSLCDASTSIFFLFLLLHAEKLVSVDLSF